MTAMGCNQIPAVFTNRAHMSATFTIEVAYASELQLPNDGAERRDRRGMKLAFYLSRDRSSACLTRTSTLLFVAKKPITRDLASQASYRGIHIGAPRSIHDVALDHRWKGRMSWRCK
jgi:hypothetical protein